jgi:hypothetical protein
MLMKAGRAFCLLFEQMNASVLPKTARLFIHGMNARTAGIPHLDIGRLLSKEEHGNGAAFF